MIIFGIYIHDQASSSKLAYLFPLYTHCGVPREPVSSTDVPVALGSGEAGDRYIVGEGGGRVQTRRPHGIRAFFLERWCRNFRLVRSSYIVALPLLPCLGCPRPGGVHFFPNSECWPLRCQIPSWKAGGGCCCGWVWVTLDCTT